MMLFILGLLALGGLGEKFKTLVYIPLKDIGGVRNDSAFLYTFQLVLIVHSTY